MTPLHYAAMWGHAEIVGLLIQRRANTNVIDASGKTPLYYAGKGDFTKSTARKDYAEAFELLIFYATRTAS